MLKQKSNIIAPIFLFLFSLALRIALLSKGPFHCDSLEILIKAQETLKTSHLHYQHGPSYPLTVIIGAVFLFFGNILKVKEPIAAINFMSACFGALDVALLYIFVKNLINKRSAFLSAILFSISPIFLSISTFGKSHNISIFFALSGLCALQNYLNAGGRKGLFLSAIFLGLSAAARLPDGLIGIVFLVYYYLYSKNLRIKEIFTLVAISLLTAILFYMPMFFEGNISQLIEATQSIYMGKFIGPFSKLLYPALILLAQMLTLTGSTLTILGLILLLFNQKRIFILLTSWSIILFFYFGNVSTLAPRFLIMASVPLIIALGYCLDYISTLKRNYLYKILALYFFAFISFQMFMASLPLLSFRHKFNLQKNFALFVQDNTEEDAAIVAVDESIFLKYYTDRKVLSRPVTNSIDEDEKYLKETISALIKNRKPVYIIETAIQYGPSDKFPEALSKYYSPKLIGKAFNEDWHREEFLEPGIFLEGLYKIEEKN